MGGRRSRKGEMEGLDVSMGWGGGVKRSKRVKDTRPVSELAPHPHH